MPVPDVESTENGSAASLLAIRKPGGGNQGIGLLAPGLKWSVEPTVLAALAERLGKGSADALRDGTRPPPWPPRPAPEVFADLASGREVAAIEIWRLLADRPWWSSLRDGRRVAVRGGEVWGATGVAIKLWELSHQHPSLRADLRWNVGKALVGATGECEPELVGNIRYAAPDDRTLLCILRDGDGVGLVNLAARQDQTPREFLARRGVPSRVPVADLASALAVNQFLRDAVRLETWLIRCLADLPAAHRDPAVDELLAQLTDADAARLPALRAALHEWYTSAGVVSGHLSAEAVARLSAWSGLFRWDAFLRFTEQRFGRRLEDLPYLQGLGLDAPAAEHTARQALGRMVVWRNYAARITGLRLYVPERSDLALFLGVAGGSADWVEHQAGVPLRLMVMIGPLLVDVPLDDREPIRGARIPQGAGRSFESARAAVGSDPVVEFAVRGRGWQSHLYYALKERQVVPNDGLRSFEGAPRNHLNSDGMPTPAPVEQYGKSRPDHTKNGKTKWQSPKKKR